MTARLSVMRPIRQQHKLVTVCLSLFWLPLLAAVTAPASSELRGLLREADTRKPIAGAMIALFDPQNELLDYTYTTANGAFALRSPNAAGKYRLEAYRDKLLKSQDVVYDPAQPAKPVLLTATITQPPWWESAGKWILDKLQILIGLVIGYFFSQITERLRDRKLFKKQRAAAKVHRDEIVKTFGEIQQLDAEERNRQIGASRDDLNQKYSTALSRLNEQLDDLESKKPDWTVIYSFQKEAGLNRYNEMLNSIKKLKKFASGKKTLPPDGWQQAGAAFEQLKSNSLLADQR